MVSARSGIRPHCSNSLVRLTGARICETERDVSSLFDQREGVREGDTKKGRRGRAGVWGTEALRGWPPSLAGRAPPCHGSSQQSVQSCPAFSPPVPAIGSFTNNRDLLLAPSAVSVRSKGKPQAGPMSPSRCWLQMDPDKCASAEYCRRAL